LIAVKPYNHEGMMIYDMNLKYILMNCWGDGVGRSLYTRSILEYFSAKLKKYWMKKYYYSLRFE